MDTKKLGTFVLCVLIGVTGFIGFNKLFVESKVKQETNTTQNVAEEKKTENSPAPIVNVEENKNLSAYEKALKDSIATNKKIVLFFTADWCGNCTKMKTKTLSDVRVKKALENYIFVELNADKELELSRKYKVKAIPSYKIIDGKETILRDGVGYRGVDEFVKWLTKNTEAWTNTLN